MTPRYPFRILRPGGYRTGRLWVYLSERDHRSSVCEYTPDRSHDGPERILKEFRPGSLQSVANSVQDRIDTQGIVQVGCLACAAKVPRQTEQRPGSGARGTGMNQPAL
jgi:hypothetical protein